ncbi:MAG TPA: DUF5666 domain-containing protein [Candidatus Saccharimonadales bacterium]|nr:DUF5666 domain-containing protein [Candidatus Saccharimonadales bacterium]
MAQNSQPINQEPVYAHHPHQKSWLMPTLIVVIIVLFLALIFSWAVMGRHGYARFAPRSGGAHGHKVGDRRLLGGNSANQSRLRGVVTAVNSNSFTLAGGGATNTVQTNGSTQYRNGSQVKVNDSVMVAGTTSNGTFTASVVAINP